MFHLYEFGRSVLIRNSISINSVLLVCLSMQEAVTSNCSLELARFWCASKAKTLWQYVDSFRIFDPFFMAATTVTICDSAHCTKRSHNMQATVYQ